MQLLPQVQRGFRLAQDAGRLLLRLAFTRLASRPIRLLCLCSCIWPWSLSKLRECRQPSRRHT